MEDDGTVVLVDFDDRDTFGKPKGTGIEYGDCSVMLGSDRIRINHRLESQVVITVPERFYLTTNEYQKCPRELSSNTV
jgi:hypothetical protein